MIGAAQHTRAARGFTLLEIMVVAMLITLLSGIAIISIQALFDQNRYKAMFPEAAEIGTALSFAYNDTGIYPRLCLINQPIDTMVITTSNNTLLARPHMDTYGYLNATMKANIIKTSWKGPYGGKSPARLSQGQRAHILMRLVDIQTIGYAAQFQQAADYNIQIVDWPADTWANPWMVYQVSKTVTNGQPVYHLIQTGEEPNFLNAVVSYGANHIPGGNQATQLHQANYYDEMKNRAALFFESGTAGADFELRSYGSNILPLSTLTSAQIQDSFYFPGTADASTGAVGMLEEGTDDIVWKF